MNKLTFDITYSSDSSSKGERYSLTLKDVDGRDSVVLELNKEQFSLIESRRMRSFYVRCKKERILQDIDDAANYMELEAIARKYYLCDACAFNDINLYGVKRMLKVIVDVLYKYPKLRSRLCFIGTHHEMEKLIVQMEQGNVDALNKFNLQYICTKENAEKLGGMVHKMLTDVIANHKQYIAMAICAFGLFDAVLLDKNDYNGYAYLKCISQLRQSEAIGFHPKECYTPESVVYHELGHLLDEMCNFSEMKSFKEYHESKSAKEIKKGLSTYALESRREFVAEAFAEFMCNPAPRKIANETCEMLNLAYLSSTMCNG
ncbi:MAG: hypothetical protein HDT36_03745 [Clostridiales bacterium]|nr:hypothetical protein [Clostridiales bacterium]